MWITILTNPKNNKLGYLGYFDAHQAFPKGSAIIVSISMSIQSARLGGGSSLTYAF